MAMPRVGLVVYVKDLKANASVCTGCGHHHRIDSEEHRFVADPDSFEALNEALEPTDPLSFKDRRAYADRLREVGRMIPRCVVTASVALMAWPWLWQ